MTVLQLLLGFPDPNYRNEMSILPLLLKCNKGNFHSPLSDQK